MPAAAKFSSTTLTKFVQDGLEPAVQSKILADFARAGVAELIATGQASPKYKRFVNGTEGLLEDAVKPDGSIAYRFGYMGEVATFALEFLQSRSPVRIPAAKGKYIDCFVIAVNGRPIKQQNFAPDSVPNDAELYIYNSQPYGRKVDVQLVGKKKLRFNVPEGLFRDAAAAVNGRFGNLVSAVRVYDVDFSGKWETKKGRKVEYPALKIGLR